MPIPFKVAISVLALAVTVSVFWIDTQAGHQGAARWIALALGPLMVFSIWMFPEAKAREIRRDAARKREENKAETDDGGSRS
ncbi:MAG: hypothetical protein ACR2RL_06700 [Gammaproteobacteria bacterium]